MFRTHAHAFSDHEAARQHEIARQAAASHRERIRQFIELQRRVWGEDNPDVRESGAVRVFRRDDEE
jgi:hypothetical protein